MTRRPVVATSAGEPRYGRGFAVRPSDDDPPEDEPLLDDPADDEPLEAEGGGGVYVEVGRSLAVEPVDPPCVCVYPRPLTSCPRDSFCVLPFTMMIGGA